MNKAKKALVMILSVFAFFLINFSDIPVIHGATSIKDYFTPQTSNENSYHWANESSWNGGTFIEVTTKEYIGFNKAEQKDVYRFRTYSVQHGPSGSYCYQSVPLGLYIDGKKVATFSSEVNKQTHNQTRLLGSIDVKLSKGKHTVTIKDEKSGADTVVNTSYTINVTPPTYKVTFKDWDGTTLKTQTVDYGRGATAPSNPSRTGYTFTGWDKSFSSVTTNLTVTAQYEINKYTNQIDHWAFGFNGEGNNSGGNAFLIGSSTFSPTYNSTFTMDTSRAIRVPNGFYLTSTFGTSSISGTWNIYSFPTNVVQKPNKMWFEYDYGAYTYTISYNLDGGTNNSANPSTYNVLYGVTLQAPTRTGYDFLGWYDDNGNKITGINQGKNANFSSATDLYNQLAARTTGNKKLTAKWQKKKYTVTVNHWMEKDTTTGAWNPTGEINSTGNMIRNPNQTSATIEYGNTYSPQPINITGYELTSNSFGYYSPDLGKWTSSPKGTAITIKSAMNFEYYYTKKTYTVNFNTNGGTSVPSQSVKYRNKAKSTTTTKSNNKFMGWYTDSALTKKFDFDTQITGNITLYAKWDEKPSIQAEDIVIFENLYTPSEWQVERIKHVTANDKEDGNITSKIKVTQDTTDLTKKGEYKITYYVEDSVGNYTSKTIKVTVVDEFTPETKTTKYVRSISSSYLNTLNAKSKWLKSPLNTTLSSSLNTPDTGVKETYVLTPQDVEKIKEFNRTHDYSPSSNQLFLSQFGYLKK